MASEFVPHIGFFSAFVFSEPHLPHASMNPVLSESPSADPHSTAQTLKVQSLVELGADGLAAKQEKRLALISPNVV